MDLADTQVQPDAEAEPDVAPAPAAGLERPRGSEAGPEAESAAAAAPGVPATATGATAAVRGLLRSTAALVALDLLPAFAVYAAVRIAGLVALSLLAGSQGVDPWPRLTSYDAMWLLGIAGGGYDPLVPDAASGHPGLSNIAFLPLYPLLVAAVSDLLGLPLATAGLAVTALSGLAAAAALDRLGRRIAGSRTAGLVLVVLWAAWPHSVVLSMAYTEALFVALAAWSMVALLSRRWLTAGVLCLLAGATRPFGAALAVAVAVTAAVAIVRALHRRTPREAVRPLAAAVLAPLGLLGYWGWLWTRTGRLDAWLHVQDEQWNSRFDGGAHTLEVLRTVATQPVPLVLLVCMLLVAAAVVLTVALALERAPLPLVVHAALVTTLVVGDAGYDHAKARFLLAAFPLLLVPARALAALRAGTLVVLLTGLVAVSSWYNAYVLILWYRSP